MDMTVKIQCTYLKYMVSILLIHDGIFDPLSIGKFQHNLGPKPPLRTYFDNVDPSSQGHIYIVLCGPRIGPHFCKGMALNNQDPNFHLKEIKNFHLKASRL